MTSNALSQLQARVLLVLAGSDVEWLLTGGVALVGYCLHHREPDDLDLFLPGRVPLDDAPLRLEGVLRAAGLRRPLPSRWPR